MKKYSKYNMLSWLWLSSLVIILDQTSKLLVLHHMSLGQLIEITPFFNIVMAYNKGAAFSFLNSAAGWQSPMFAVVAIIIGIVIVYWLYKLPRQRTWLTMALAFILGGAIGNLLDRIMHGFVIDFLDLHMGNLHWPAFNIADTVIVIGAIMLVIDLVSQRKIKASN